MINEDFELKDAVMKAAVKHAAKADKKCMSYIRLKWDVVDGNLTIVGITTQFRNTPKPKKTEPCQPQQ